MTRQEVGSMIAIYLVALLFLITAHLAAYGIEGNMRRHNEDNKRKTIIVGWKWLFWRGKKGNGNEILLFIFVHELITIILLLITTGMLVISLVLKNEYFILFPTLVSVVYGSYFHILSNHIEEKIKKSRKNSN